MVSQWLWMGLALSHHFLFIPSWTQTISTPIYKGTLTSMNSSRCLLRTSSKSRCWRWGNKSNSNLQWNGQNGRKQTRPMKHCLREKLKLWGSSWLIPKYKEVQRQDKILNWLIIIIVCWLTIIEALNLQLLPYRHLSTHQDLLCTSMEYQLLALL